MSPARSISHPAFLILAAILLMALAAAAAAQVPTLHVGADAPGIALDPDFYGIFFEEINHAGDGGLYAEMVRNRSFEDAATPDNWTLEQRDGTGQMALATSVPLNLKNTHYLHVTADSVLSGGRVGVSNSGFWGVAVKSGESYNFSVYARRNGDAPQSLMVTIERPGGSVLASARIDGLTTTWTRYTATLTPFGDAADARLVVATPAAGAFDLDMVSLFPAVTFHGRPQGLRVDLASKLADLHPSFMRFPGGSFVDGLSMSNAPRFEDTIGDIATRPGRWDLWGYRSSDGLGFLEYLELCEDLGAQPLYVINCAMDVQNNPPPDSELDFWINEALHAIEYADGPTTSTWGARRAADGHPAPFHLKYVEIGNENGGSTYNTHYALFYNAIKSRYPDIQLIANATVNSAPIEIIDEHYYNSPDWFRANASRYDTYNRNGPQIYVGEYACTQGVGQGNLIGALAEGAFILGMERNADIVKMHSYAPLFVNIHDRRWNPDLIGFDNSVSYGTPSYYVQQMLASHRGDRVLPTTLTLTAADYDNYSAPSGAIGLATWSTQAEYRNVTVTSGPTTLYASDFASGASEWNVASGDWSVVSGAWRQTNTGTNMRSTTGDPNWTDYSLRLQARKISGSEGFLVMFHVKDADNWYWLNLGGWNNTRNAIERSFNGSKSVVAEQTSGVQPIQTDHWYDIRIDVSGNSVKCWLDGTLIIDKADIASPSSRPQIAAAAQHDDTHGVTYLRLINFAEQPKQIRVITDGATTDNFAGSIEVLTSDSMTDENSIAEPTKVFPTQTPIRTFAPDQMVTLAPRSLSVLTLVPRRSAAPMLDYP